MNKKIQDVFNGFVLKDWISITIGALCVAAATNLFYVKQDLVTGGVSGIGIIIRNFFDVPLWLTTLVFNIPLFIILFSLKGKNMGFKSIYGMLMLTLFLYATENVSINIDDILLISIYGGVLTGIGAGLVFTGLGTTGGTDIIAVIIKHFLPYISITNIIRIIEIIIVSGGTIIFGIEKALYAVISIFVYSKVTSVILEGLRFGRATYIISNKYDEISEEIMKRLSRGATLLNGKGMFSKEDKKIILCIVKVKQLPILKEIVSSIDKEAFMFISDVREIQGNGFYVRTIED